MTPFLQRIAETFYRTYGDKIVRLAFVFPNRRSGIFFQHYLAQVAGKPIFSPTIYTVNELMTSLSHLQPVDRTELLFTLYEEYLRLRESDESFDRFLFWGEMLAGDFDDVDKYMVDATQLFTNIEELREIEMPYLTEEQIEIIQQFWHTYFTPDTNSNKKEAFRSLWSVLLELYTLVKERLAAKGVGYEGMIFREVADAATEGRLILPNHSRIVFVGFNAITEAERVLMSHLRDSGKGDFYWDYYAPTLQDDENRAAYFIDLNKRQFPSQLDIGEELITTLPEITVMPISSGTGQAKEAGEILEELIADGCINPQHALNTAIVLPDEELLMPMLYSVPTDFTTINITMGYALRNTPAATLFDAIYQMQRHVRWSRNESLFYHLEVRTILNHRFIKELVGTTATDIVNEMAHYNKAYVSEAFMARHPLLSLIFRTIRNTEQATHYLQEILAYLLKNTGVETNAIAEENDGEEIAVSLSKMEREYLYHYQLVVQRLQDVMLSHHVAMEVDTYFALINKMVATLSVPFSGEPLSGLQIMGVLETRALDFENIIILSMNEGVFPMKKIAGSFIPYNLRRGFALATTEHQDSIYAYYFYRMISRAKRVFLLYDSRTDGMKRGEMSRYIYQLQYHYSQLLPHLKIAERHISHNVAIEPTTAISISKTGGIATLLYDYLAGGNRRLSASGINTYLNCPLQFYLEYVEQIRRDDEITEAIDSSLFGSIYHGVMGEIYDRMKYGEHAVVVTDDMINAILKDKRYINHLIAKWFAREFFKLPPDKAEHPEPLRGQHFITAHIIRQYVEQTLTIDKAITPFTYIATEQRLEENLTLTLRNGKQVNFKAFIDRIDCTGNTLRIIDYKTGSDDLKTPSIEALFDKRIGKRPKAIFQVLLYCKLYRTQYPDDLRTLQPLIYKVKSLFGDFCSNIKLDKTVIDDYDTVAETYEEQLDACLTEMFDDTIPFTQTDIPEHCQYCDFKAICKR